MNFLFLIALGVLFSAAHSLNYWLFDFANINSHVSLIYLPAFLRLFNVLVLGPIYGTGATFVGGLILMTWSDEPLSLALLNVASSCAGPIVAMMGFRFYFGRRIQLTSLKELGWVTVIYAILNSLIHHTIWFLFDDHKLMDSSASFWMLIGDLNGALLGAYLFKAGLDYLERKGIHLSGTSQPKS
jgi:hypothetical protein